MNPNVHVHFNLLPLLAGGLGYSDARCISPFPSHIFSTIIRLFFGSLNWRPTSNVCGPKKRITKKRNLAIHNSYPYKSEGL